MEWQDVIMSVVGIMFAVSMVPAVLAGIKAKRVDLPWATLVVTTAGIVALLVCTASFGYVLASVTNGCNALCWGALLALKMRYIHCVEWIPPDPGDPLDFNGNQVGIDSSSPCPECDGDGCKYCQHTGLHRFSVVPTY